MSFYSTNWCNMVPGTELHFHTRSPTDMPEQNLNPEILAAALHGLEAQRARLDAHIAEARRLLGARPQEPTAPAEAPKPRRKMSAAGRRRIAAATKKRWAEYHRKQAAAGQKARQPAAAAKTPRPRRKLSAAARKRMAEGAKKRRAAHHRQKAEAAKAKEPAVKGKAAPKKAAEKTTARGKMRAATVVAKQLVAAEVASE